MAVNGITYSTWYNDSKLSDEDYAAQCAQVFEQRHGYVPRVLIGPYDRGIIIQPKTIALYPVVKRKARIAPTERSYA